MRTINKQFSSSGNMLKFDKQDGSNIYSNNNNTGKVEKKNKLETVYNSKVHDTNEENYKNGKNRIMKQMSDIYNYNTKHNTHMLKKKNFNENENIMSVRSLNLDIHSENMEFNGKQEMKNSQTDTSNAFDELFSKNEFKVKKIKETQNKNKNNMSSNNNNKVKKNPTSILPFDRIIEKHFLNNVISKQNIHQLYSHKNIYDENVGDNYTSHIPNIISNHNKNNNDNNNNNNNKRLEVSYDNYKDDTYPIRENVVNSDKDMFDVDEGMQIFSRDRNSPTSRDENNLDNTEMNGRNNWNEQLNKTSINSRTKNKNETSGEWENGFILNQHREEKESDYNITEGLLSRNEEFDDVQQIHNSENNKKVTYYSVVNHYNPYTNKESSVENKNSDIYNNYSIYENDIYDYLLNQYEKNYKKLILQKQPIRKALTEYWEEGVEKYNAERIKEYEVQHNEKKQNIQVEEVKDDDADIKDINTREPTSESDEDSIYSRYTSRSENEKEKHKKKEQTEKEMKNCKLISKKDIPENKTSFSTYSSEVLQSINNYDIYEDRNTKEHGKRRSCNIVFSDDTFDIYKDVECIHTQTPQLFAYTTQSKTSNGEHTLKINKECKKIFKKMKNKNTVVISNIGRKSGSSTFSNFIINNLQLNNFTSNNHDKENCVYAYMTTNKNKINYIYLDYDKLNINRNSANRRKSDKSGKNEIGESKKNNNKWKQQPNKLMSLSFYFSNIVIIHIDSNNYLDMFSLIADYYTIIKNIKESIRQKRKKYKAEKRRKEKINNMKDNFIKLNKNAIGKNFSEEPMGSDSSYLESDDSNKDVFDEKNLYFPYFIFLFKNVNSQIGTQQKEQTMKESFTEKENNRENNPLENYKNVQEYLDYLVSKIKNKTLKSKLEYVFNFFTKKNLVYLPPLYNSNKDSIISYDYIDTLKKIKKDLYVHSKSIDNMYNNNGLYMYKYLNMITYTINNNVYYSCNNLKKKIEIFENKMLHDILTENFLINIRTKIEKNLPLKADFLLTLMNEQKVDYILTYEKFAAGNESTKKKYKGELITNIDNIILKAYKENLAYSYFSFYNEINKKIENLKITDKINNGTYESFDQLLTDLENVNDENKENLVYNEIFNKVKEDIVAQFVKKNYQDKHTQTAGKLYSKKALIHNNTKNNGSNKTGKHSDKNKYDHFLNYNMTEDNEYLTEKQRNDYTKINKAIYQTTKGHTLSSKTKGTNEKNGIMNNEEEHIQRERGDTDEELEKKNLKKYIDKEKSNQKKKITSEYYDNAYKEYEVVKTEGAEEEEDEEEEDEEDEEEEQEGEEDEEEEEEEEMEDGEEGWEVQRYANLSEKKKYYKDSDHMVFSDKSVENSKCEYTKNPYQNSNSVVFSKRKATLQKLKKMNNLNKMKGTDTSFNDMGDNNMNEKSVYKKKIQKNQPSSFLKNPLYATFHKNKSDRYLTDNRKKHIRKINHDIKKYHSADFANGRSNIQIYKHLMNYENSHTSGKSTDECFYVPTESNKDINKRTHIKKDYSFENTLTDDADDGSNIEREELSNYTKKLLKNNFAKYSTEMDKSKKSCLPKSGAKWNLKEKLKKKPKCLIM